MDDPFSDEEILLAVKAMPLDHALGPDGFNGLFYKKCWNLIAADFRRLCDQFYLGDVSLHNINGSFITLIPKKQDPETVNGFRPISLLNCSKKLITKMLANRLQYVITQVVRKNQFAFISGRNIQDCLA